MPDSLQLEILTREKVLLSTTTAWVALPAEKGEMVILPQHAPLITTLSTGVLSYQAADEIVFVAVHYGYARTDGKKVVVMCKMCELSSEIDFKRARLSEQSTRKIMQETFSKQAELSHMGVYEAKLKRATIRQDVCRQSP